MTLREGQWQIEDIVFGKDTKYLIEVAPDVSYAEVQTQDVRIPRGDGMFFGRDYYAANTITFEMNLWSNDLEGDFARFARWWRGHPVRKTPRAVIPLKYCYNGVQKQVFGRPRNFAPVASPTGRQWEHFICDFQCVDDKFYSQEEFWHRVQIRPPALGGFITPLISPLIMTGTTESQGGTDFNVDGTVEAWTRMVVHGPLTNIEFELYDNWKQRMPMTTLRYDQSVTVNSYPWSRSIVRENGVSVAGAFDKASRKLSALVLPPGENELVLRGNDPTGTSYIDIFWHEAYLAL